MTDRAVAELAGRIGVRDGCVAVGASQAGYYRRHRLSPAPAAAGADPAPRPAPAACPERPEQQAILDVLHSDRFVDMSPAEVWATLLDDGVYLGSSRPSTGCYARPARGATGAAKPPTRPR